MIKTVKISEVKSNPRNPRVIKDNKFDKLVKSIQDFPDMLNKRPLIVFTDKDGKYVVLGGNMRLKALNYLGIKTVPVIIADEWTEEQKNEFLIKDNVGFGEWDWDSLANEWDTELLTDWALDLPNFDFDENEVGEIEDIDLVEGFNEAVNFTIKCESLEQLEELKTKLNTDSQKIGYHDFIIKAGL